MWTLLEKSTQKPHGQFGGDPGLMEANLCLLIFAAILFRDYPKITSVFAVRVRLNILCRLIDFRCGDCALIFRNDNFFEALPAMPYRAMEHKFGIEEIELSIRKLSILEEIPLMEKRLKINGFYL